LSRILGIDFGGKRTGLAVTDPLQIIVTALDAVLTADLESYLSKYFLEEKVIEIAIGYPTHKDGSKTYLCAEIDDFIERIRKSNPTIKITKVDESFSSIEGKTLLLQSNKKKKKRQEKGQLDMYSAVVILRQYLGH